MSENREGSSKELLTPFHIVQMRARTGWFKWTVFIFAIFMAAIEIFYVMNFLGNISDFIGRTISEELGNKMLQTLTISDKSVKALVMGSLVFIGFLIFPVKRPPLKATDEELREYKRKYIDNIPVIDIILAVLALVAFGYRAYLGPYFEANESSIPPDAVVPSIIATILAFALVFELTRRAVGPWLTAVVSAFLLYYFYFYHSTMAMPTTYNLLSKWAGDMFAGTSGLFNVPFQVMAAYVFAFLFFGTFLERIGIGEYITNMMLGLFGNRAGGPAKVAIVSSGFMGMLSGSSVANVFTTGTFTIPLMKKSGFPGEVAGAIEASASTGGQIMPPIMGAAAFIMASYLGRPYGEIVIAAFIPATIYFLSLYYFVDLEAKRLGLKGIPKEQLPNPRRLARKLYLLSPIVLITILLVVRLPPQHSVVASLSLALVSAAWAMEDIKLSGKIGYTIALILLGLIAFATGMNYRGALYFTGVFFLIISLALIITKEYKRFAWVILESIEQAVRNSVPVFMAAAMAGVVQGSLTLTGLSTTLGDKLITIAHNNIYLLLIFIGLISILVGMGVPTTANYVITSLIGALAIAKAAMNVLGIAKPAALLGAHMFVFYYGILADLTPPVALAAFAGATVARADFWKTAINATRFGFTKYVLPFVFAVNPAMLVLPVLEGYATPWMFAWSLITIAAVIITASAGFAGYFGGKINSRVWRVVLSIFGILAVTGNPVLVLIAYALSAITYVLARAERL
ncbi:MAG: TRAP transporter fused permease subunit [Desulfurococcales archaeon]|nr:TRAP transporter fused permease subunit [Desulfurococcales archaeon]